MKRDNKVFQWACIGLLLIFTGVSYAASGCASLSAIKSHIQNLTFSENGYSFVNGGSTQGYSMASPGDITNVAFYKALIELPDNIACWYTVNATINGQSQEFPLTIVGQLNNTSQVSLDTQGLPDNWVCAGTWDHKVTPCACRENDIASCAVSLQ